MNRYVVVKGLYDVPQPSHGGNQANWLVVDLTSPAVVADCGDNQSRANNVAQALNDLDGGPL